MAGRWAMWVALAAACGGSRPEPAAEEAPVNAYLPPDPVVADPVAQTAEPMGFAAFEGTLGVTITVGGRATHHSVGVEQASLRFGDVRTLQHPIGHLKLDPTAWQSHDEPGWASIIVDTWLRDDRKVPVQVFFDVGNFAAIDGVLEPGGAARETTVIGAVQVDSRKIDFDARVRVSRPEAERLRIEIIGEAPLDVSGFARDARTAALSAALGGAVAPTVGLSGVIELPRWRELAMPNFVRTAVTMATVAEIHDAAQDEVDRYELSKEGAASSGIDDHLLQQVDRKAFDRMEEEIRAKQAERARRR